MNPEDVFMLALTMWREQRGGGRVGMTSVACVIKNRAKKNGTSYYDECVRPLQFSSITAHGDPELTLWPDRTSHPWQVAMALAEGIDKIEDITDGATMYYAPAGVSDAATYIIDGAIYNFPAHWDKSKLQFTKLIQGQLFFKEI